jgi:hypothetical protein
MRMVRKNIIASIFLIAESGLLRKNQAETQGVS